MLIIWNVYFLADHWRVSFSFFSIWNFWKKLVIEQHFIVSVRITVWSAVKVKYAQMTLTLPQISITNQFTTSFESMNRNIVEQKISVHDSAVDRWWPNGYGKQKLYKLVVSVSYEGS